MKEIKFDAVIIGATGFTGKWVLDQMAKTVLKPILVRIGARDLFFIYFFPLKVFIKKSLKKISSRPER